MGLRVRSQRCTCVCVGLTKMEWNTKTERGIMQVSDFLEFFNSLDQAWAFLNSET